MCPAEIIAPLVQEGTRNRLQMTPKQTPSPQSPPAPAWLFSISPTSLFLTLCRGMEAAKRGGPRSSRGAQLSGAQSRVVGPGSGSLWGEGPPHPPHTSLPCRSAQQQRGDIFTTLFSSLPRASRLPESRRYLPSFPSTGGCVSWVSGVKMT